MRRLVVLVTVALLMVAMLVSSAGSAQAIMGRVPFGPDGGVAVPRTACTVLADDSAMYEWRAGGRVCWANNPVHNIFSVVGR